MENQTAFDLNAAVQSWRTELAKSSSFYVDDLDELESHVRDSAASLQMRGLTEEEAFLITIRRIGSRDALAEQFAAINGPSVWLKRLLWMTTGWIAMSALLSITVTLLVGAGLTWFYPVILLSALIGGLQSDRLRKPLTAFLSLTLLVATGLTWFSPFSLLLALTVVLQLGLLRKSLPSLLSWTLFFTLGSLCVVVLKMSVKTGIPMTDVMHNYSYVLYNLTFVIQCLVCTGVIAVFGIKRLRRNSA